MTKEPKILCVTDYYAPGYRGGGVVRTLQNLASTMAEASDFKIYTRDRDLGSDRPYPMMSVDDWNDFEGAPVYYASPQEFGWRGLRDVLAQGRFDVVYLNSFFSLRGSIEILWRLRFSSRISIPILLAPRGEFSAGALRLKPNKKRTYISLARQLGLYDGVHWHASTDLEAADITQIFPHAGKRMHIARDPVSGFTEMQLDAESRTKKGSQLRLAFVSRISPKKNLLFLVQVLSRVSAVVELNVYGPIEDARYWEACEQAATQLPEHVSFHYCGVLAPEDVSSTFAEHDLFVFPTLGENFGHVIYESLRGGTAVVVSDQTPWTSHPSGAVSTLTLSSFDAWVAEIQKAALMGERDRQKVRLAAREIADGLVDDELVREQNLAMFLSVAGSSERER